MEYVTLNNGVKMSKPDYGVYQMPIQDTRKRVLEAIEADHRSIDTARAYGNEDNVGNILAACSLLREELSTTAKVWTTNAGYKKTKRFIDEPSKKLKTDYIDFLLTHQPLNDYYKTYRAMEEACRARKIRAIGVSNFHPDCLTDLRHFVGIKLAISQVETHVSQQQKKTHEIMKGCDVQTESWGLFTERRKDFSNSSVFNETGSRHGKPATQATLCFSIQRDVVVISKTAHRERTGKSINVFDFVLVDEEMKVLAGLDQGESTFFSHYDPEAVEFLTGLGIQYKAFINTAVLGKRWEI